MREKGELFPSVCRTVRLFLTKQTSVPAFRVKDCRSNRSVNRQYLSFCCLRLPFSSPVSVSHISRMWTPVSHIKQTSGSGEIHFSAADVRICRCRHRERGLHLSLSRDNDLLNSALFSFPCLNYGALCLSQPILPLFRSCMHTHTLHFSA